VATSTTTESIGYGQGPALKAPAWHALVTWDMLLNGLTTGLFLVAALGELALPETFAPVARWAYPLALLFLAADLLLLTLDLGDPLRFHRMLRMFKPGSPMSVGVWSLTIYSLPLTVATLLSVFSAGGILETVRVVAVVLGLTPALASAAYKGVLLSTTAQHGWKDGRWLGAALTSGAVVLGCAAMLVLAHATGHAAATALLRPAFAALLVAHAVPLLLTANELWPAGGGAPEAAARRTAFTVALVGSLLVPMVLLWFAAEPAGSIIAAATVTLGSLVNRHALVRRPHEQD
jgi:Ni/Fe-hydrogenase subunit HybB-like protein